MERFYNYGTTKSRELRSPNMKMDHTAIPFEIDLESDIVGGSHTLGFPRLDYPSSNRT